MTSKCFSCILLKFQSFALNVANNQFTDKFNKSDGLLSSVLLLHTCWEGAINPSIYSISREEGASKQREHSFGLREDGRRSWMSDLDCKEGDLDLGSCLTSGKGWGVNCDVKDTAGVICNGKQQL